MFQKAELMLLQEQKDLLVLQSEANRRQLAEDWQKLRSPGHWLDEATRVARGHPVWTVALAAVAGVVVVQAFRKPGALAGGVGRLAKLASLGLAAWRMFASKS